MSLKVKERAIGVILSNLNVNLKIVVRNLFITNGDVRHRRIIRQSKILNDGIWRDVLHESCFSELNIKFESINNAMQLVDFVLN